MEELTVSVSSKNLYCKHDRNLAEKNMYFIYSEKLCNCYFKQKNDLLRFSPCYRFPQFKKIINWSNLMKFDEILNRIALS